MLSQLYIKNYTLLDRLDMEFHPGFSVITGETGAGKSIILGAIGLLLGQRADSKDIKAGCEKCLIEAHFDISRYALESFFQENDIEYDATDCIIRRELTASKSRAFINDTPVPLSLLKELGEQLVDVHSQHQNLLLNKQDFQLSVLDVMSANLKTQSYATAYSEYQTARQQLKELEESIARNRDNADFLQFQYNELCNARLVAGEQEELEQRQDTMSHAEDIKAALYETDNALSAEGTGIVGQLKSAIHALNSIEKVLPSAAELSERMDSCHIELKDMAQDISSLLEDVDFDPAELDSVNNRLDTLYSLEKKYHCDSVEALLAQQEQLKQQLSNIENSDEALATLTARVTELKAVCQQQADKLTAQRSKAARIVEQQMLQRLVPLGMPNIRFEVRMEKTELGHSGQDKVSFLFSANTSTPLQPVSQVASGGEIARVMLALKAMISGTVKLPTIIFDEIDTGVSGKIAESMAHMMQEMGQGGRQVISITHLPQIAALGSSHYLVYKEETPQGTASRMQQLDADQRVREIAQMLSGNNITEAAINNAKELLSGLRPK
ncbi:MAG: DNA repair protein RecN [Prevotella sp.]|nr:DNA repair protein RecN [Prevotella sp.]